MEVMSSSGSRRFPVTVTHLPVTRCQICHRTVAYRPGSLSEVLTEHYRRAHPKRSASLPSSRSEDPHQPPPLARVLADSRQQFCTLRLVTPAAADRDRAMMRAHARSRPCTRPALLHGRFCRK